jgi:predicted nuclease of predicted toxin-antitoxin system
MSLRIFADHCVSNFIVLALRSDGHEVFRLRDHIPHASPDTEVIRKAQELDAILLSLNGDFADIVSYPPSDYAGIVALEIRDHPEVTEIIINRLRAYFREHPDGVFYRGKLLVVEPHRIRIRI